MKINALRKNYFLLKKFILLFDFDVSFATDFQLAFVAGAYNLC